MTKIYFIRHAQADNSVRDGSIRPLTQAGLVKRLLATEYLRDKNIHIIFSSPYKRAYDTIADFAEQSNLDIHIIDDFREQRSSGDMRRNHPNFRQFLARQWEDFDYTFSDGENLREVQERNIAALKIILTTHKNKNIVIGTHATALSVMINYYDNSYGFKDFEEMEYKLPWVAEMTFNGLECVKIKKVDLE